MTVRRPAALALVLVLLAACDSRPSSPQGAPAPDAQPPALSSAANAGDAGTKARVDEIPPPPPSDPRAPKPITLDAAKHALFGTAVPVEAASCKGDVGSTIACLVGVRYAADDEAKKLALDLYTRFGTVVGQGENETMDGGYRGHIRLVPALPTGKDRKHLVWLHAALTTIDTVMTTLEQRARARAADGGVATVGYRYKPILVKFVRSLDGKHTPSGFALDWAYSYNIEGSLNVSAEAVLNLAVHEIFHLNDTAGAGTWSDGALGSDVTSILRKCKVPNVKAAGASTPCLTPYSPTTLQVRGGTYYAFQPGNRITLEYAAELSTRVFDEERARLGLGPAKPAFKCGPPENARSYAAMVDGYFAGLDLVPACP